MNLGSIYKHFFSGVKVTPIAQVYVFRRHGSQPNRSKATITDAVLATPVAVTTTSALTAPPWCSARCASGAPCSSLGLTLPPTP